MIQVTVYLYRKRARELAPSAVSAQREAFENLDAETVVDRLPGFQPRYIFMDINTNININMNIHICLHTYVHKHTCVTTYIYQVCIIYECECIFFECRFIDLELFINIGLSSMVSLVCSQSTYL